jgi:hypothetical protein
MSILPRGKWRRLGRGGVGGKLWRCAWVGVLVAVCVGGAWGQTFTGRILGTIHDTQGAAVVGAAVTITDVQRGVARALTTDSAGQFLAADLIPGDYKVRVEANGFNAVEQQGVNVEVARDINLDLELKPGDVHQVITVTQEIPLLDTTTSSLGGTLDNQEITDLPLNGRNYENLLQLRPGVVRYPGGGFSTTSTNGLRAEDNAYLIDGLFNSEPFSGQSIINGAGIAGDSATILPVDSIQEFNVIENPPAQYGWKPGAMVNVALKSGTNSLHGSAYGFFRTTDLDARNYFNPVGQAKNPRNLKQFGATAGGPVITDKFFFFGAYEGQRYTVGNTGVLSTPATVSLGGDPLNSVPDAIAGVIAQGITPSAASLKIGGCTLGPPISCDGSGFPLNNGSQSPTHNSINFGLPNSVSADNAVGKLDFHPNDRNTISGLYFFGNNNGTVSDADQLQPKWLTLIHTRAQVLGASWTWTPSATWVNEARFGFNRLYQPTFTADHNLPATSYGLDTGVTNPLYGGLPRINISDFYVFPQELGGFNWPKVQGPDQRFQFIDHVTRTFGRHAVQFGGEIHRDSFSGGAYGGSRGRIKFGFGADAFPGATSLEDFFAGVPASGSLLIGDPTRHISNWGYAAFVQDDWRVSSHVTVNLGLRYEINTVIKDSNDLLGNFDPSVGLVQVGKQISKPYNGDYNNFAPRVGLAWDPTGTGKTVFRAGAGIIYETLNWESFLALNNTLGLGTIPTGAIGVAPGGGSIDTGAINFPGSALNWNGTVFPTTPLNCAANPCTILAVDPKLTTPWVTHWTANVEHSFTRNLVLQVAYVGNHGADLVGIHDINQNVPSKDFLGDEQSGRPFDARFPFLSFIYQMGNIYKSNYNGLQSTLTARNYHGFTFLAGYTYSHALDDVGANWDFGAGSGLPQDSAHPGREYASSDFDMRHRFTLSTTYAVPGVHSFAHVLEGWEITSIVSLFGAQPWGPIDTGTDVSHTGEGVDRWDFFGNPSDFKPERAVGIPWFDGVTNPFPAECLAHANTPALMASLNAFGCYMEGNSVMIPPAGGTFGTMGRNTFRDLGFRDWDMSVVKNTKVSERLNVQFRAEFFNFLNHPNFANPFGGQNGWGHNDPSVPGAGGFGCACATPDVAASNPVIGSGGSRAVQLGLKFIF